MNSAIQNDTALGLLMHDFHAKDPKSMHYQELASKATYFKYNTKGVNEMCKIMQSLVDEAVTEAKLAKEIEVANTMLENNEPIDKVVLYSKLPRETVLELAQQKSA